MYINITCLIGCVPQLQLHYLPRSCACKELMWLNIILESNSNSRHIKIGLNQNNTMSMAQTQSFKACPTFGTLDRGKLHSLPSEITSQLHHVCLSAHCQSTCIKKRTCNTIFGLPVLTNVIKLERSLHHAWKTHRIRREPTYYACDIMCELYL